MSLLWNNPIEIFSKDVGLIQLSVERAYHLRHIGIEADKVLHQRTHLELLFLYQDVVGIECWFQCRSQLTHILVALLALGK